MVIDTNKSIEEIAHKLAVILTIKFEAPDRFAHGYDQYLGRLDDCLIWLSPNLVPNGFVRKDEDRYDDLIKLAKGNVSRFPEIPANSLLMSFSDEYMSDIVAKQA